MIDPSAELFPARHGSRGAATVAEVAAFLRTPVIGSADVSGAVLRDVVDDSRSISPGDAYVAIPGQRWHGLDFQDQAAAAGAVVAISDRSSALLPTLVVDDPRAIVGPLAAWFHQSPPGDQRGIQPQQNPCPPSIVWTRGSGR